MVPEGGELRWPKKSMRKMQPAITAIKPVLATRRRTKSTSRRLQSQNFLISNTDSAVALSLNGLNVGLLETDIHGFNFRRCLGKSSNILVVKEEKEDVSILGEGVPEGGKHKWKKKSVNKIQPVKRVIKPILAASRRKRPMPRRN
jgi:hypothetical protein